MMNFSNFVKPRVANFRSECKKENCGMLIGPDKKKLLIIWKNSSAEDASFVSGVDCLLSVPLGEQASGRRWNCSGLGHVARRCFGTKWYTMMFRGHGVPEMLTPAMRTTAVLLVFFTYLCLFSFAMTSGLTSDSEKFEIITTLHKAQKFGDMRPYKIFFFLITH